MKWKIKKSQLSGNIIVPPSKSHTIRAILLASIADGTSTITGALLEGDGESALQASESMGIDFTLKNNTLKIVGSNGCPLGGVDKIDFGNSGTSTRLFTGVASLGERKRYFTGDDSLKERPMRQLLDALATLGANYTIESKNTDIPFSIQGPIKGGKVTVDGTTSQFVSSLLFTCPLAKNDSEIVVENVNEKPYIEMTLWWLDKLGIKYTASDNLNLFKIAGEQKYPSFDIRIPGDFSSATFGAVAGAICGENILLDNIDFSDPQGDKEVFEILKLFGANVNKKETSATVSHTSLIGQKIDLNGMPDALPALSVLGCVAEGTTSLVNVPQARIKETDRIAVMCSELKKMGADISELDDGLVIKKSNLQGAYVNAKKYNDHRLVMALALAGMVADGETIIDNAECASVTYPTFVEDFKTIGANIEVVE